MINIYDSLIYRVTGIGADDTVLWASDSARKISFYNPAGRRLGDVFGSYFDDSHHSLATGSYVGIDGAVFVANVMEIGLEDCLLINLYPLDSGIYIDEDDISSQDEELEKRAFALKLAVRDLEINRKRIKNSSEIAGMGCFVYLSDQKCLVLSPEACRIIGVSEDTGVMNAEELCSRVKGDVNGICESIAGSGIKAHFETEIVIAYDSADRNIKVVLDKLSDDDHSLDGVFIDVTNLKRKELAMIKQDEFYRVLFNKINIGIVIIDKNGDIVRCNDFLEQLTGFSSQEFIDGKCKNLFLCDDDRLRIEETVANVFKTGKGSLPADLSIKKKDGSVTDTLIMLDVFSSDNEQFVFVFFSDISEYKKIQEQNIEQERMLLQQSKMATMGEMMGIIAHQWMQPLNSIAMLVQMMQELLELDEESQQFVRKTVSSILDQIKFMTDTANDFRKFLKPSEKATLFSPAEAVTSVLDLYRPQLKYNEIKCGMFFDSEDAKRAMVYGYENEFKNVIMNLCTNARDALEQNNVENAEIEIFFETVGDKLCISAFDNGGGIPQYILDKIFSAYVSSKGEKGTGLGLYMSRLIIKERMNGDITAANTEKGAVIKITLKNENSDAPKIMY